MSNRRISRLTDSLLLTHYVRDENQGAFRELVQRYQQLVVGVALRRSGDIELARDVAQQVFAAVARKANTLKGRESLAGWLHRASIYEANRAVQSENRRKVRHEVIRLQESVPQWFGREIESSLVALDEAIDELPSKDREVVTMHYFQDLSYQEIAGVLGLNQTAVRKRVSRAMQRLAENLHEKGVKQPVAALLAAAVAVQNSVGVPAGLAQSAVALAAAGAGSSALLPLTTMFSKMSLKAAAVVAAAALIYFVSPTGHGEGKADQLVKAGSATDANAGAQATAPGQGFVAQQSLANPQTAIPIVPGGAASIGRSRPGALSASVANPAQTSTSKPVPPATLSAPARVEIAKSVGQQLAMGQPAGALAGGVAGAADTSVDLSLTKLPVGDLESLSPLLNGILGDIPSLPGLLRELELLPSDAAEFYSVLLDEALSFTPLEYQRVRESLEQHFQQRALAGLAGPRPAEIDETEWKGNRTAILQDAVERVANAVPEAEGAPEIVHRVLDLADSQPDNPAGVGDVTEAASDGVDTLPDVVTGLSPIEAASDGVDILPNVVTGLSPIR